MSVSIDIKNISVQNFLEIANSRWLIKQYFENIPDVEHEYFNVSDENEIIKSKEFSNLQNVISKKFSWK